jgi:CheY-like chemotaxis protein
MSARRLLVVDNDPGICAFVQEVAGDLGFEVETVTDPGKCIHFYETFAPDVIVLDIVMPGIDGIELLRELAKKNCHALIIMITGYDGSYLNMAKEISEAFGFRSSITTLAKPFGYDRLAQAIERPL